MSRWVAWHDAYDDADGPLARRLAIVQQCIADALDTAPPGPIRVVSMCAGEARDLLGVLAHHERADDVTGRLVELDPELASRARATAPDAIEVRCADASNTTAYAGAVPADLVLACGVFGNVAEGDIARTIATLPSLCAPGATVIWTRHRRPPDRTVLARDAFAAAGFEEVAFVAPDGFLFGVGVNRLAIDPPPFVSGIEMFSFVGYDALAGRCSECRFVYDLSRDSSVARLASDAESFAARLRTFDDAAVRTRPIATVWSPLEYACHVRDVLSVQRARVLLMQREQEPTLTPMGRGEHVVEDGYNEQDPNATAVAIIDEARALVEVLQAFDDRAWQRAGFYTYPTVELRTVEWIAMHTVHELQHHRRDIGG